MPMTKGCSITANERRYFQTNLLKWFDVYGRHDLPWQINKTPYKVWLSEVMLQQTQVSTVIPYFNAFMKSFPNIAKLAKAPLDTVLNHWAGLGYYRRARYLHMCAQEIYYNQQSTFPHELKDLIALPGIGQSTAGAILSLSMNTRATILDGNVKRVLARFFAIEIPINENSKMSHLWEIAEKLTPHKRFDDYNQAMMDLGATCCKRHKPQCSLCPLSKRCKAYQSNRVLEFPVRIKAKKAKPKRETRMLLIVNVKNELLFEQRSLDGIWPGLYAFPECSVNKDPTIYIEQQWGFKNEAQEKLKPIIHQFTHFTLTIYPIIFVLCNNNHKIKQPYSWHHPKNKHLGGFPAPVTKILEQYISKYISRDC